MIEAHFSGQQGSFRLDAAFTAPESGVTALFGPSGCGKTTVLRCVAGLIRFDKGKLIVNGETWQSDRKFVPTHRRALGYVFQEASLFPHLSVRKNLEFGLKRARRRSHTIAFDDVVDLLGVGQLFDRPTAHLSGGERQRVAIGRALLSQPQLLLMDEPLSALDRLSREEILPYLERLHDELEIPVCYVSHVPDEVARLADYVVLLSEGRVVAAGGLRETMARLDLPTAFTEDAGVVIEAVVADHDETYRLTRLDFPGGSVVVARRQESLGRRLRFRVHARDVSLALARAEGTSIVNLLPATVVEVADADTPAHVLVRLDAGGTPLIARITRYSLDHLNVAPGKSMWAQIKAVALLG